MNRDNNWIESELNGCLKLSTKYQAPALRWDNSEESQHLQCSLLKEFFPLLWLHYCSNSLNSTSFTTYSHRDWPKGSVHWASHTQFHLSRCDSQSQPKKMTFSIYLNIKSWQSHTHVPYMCPRLECPRHSRCEYMTES